MSATRRSTRLTNSATRVVRQDDDGDVGDDHRMDRGKKGDNKHLNVVVKLYMNVDDEDANEKGDNDKVKDVSEGNTEIATEEGEEREEIHTAEPLKKLTVREIRKILSSTGREVLGNAVSKNDIIAIMLQALSDHRRGGGENVVVHSATVVDGDDMDEASEQEVEA